MSEHDERTDLAEENRRLRARIAALEKGGAAPPRDQLHWISLALQHAPYGAVVASTASEGAIQFANAEFTAITGYQIADVPTVARWIERAYPDPDYRAQVMANWQRDVSEPGRDVVYRVRCRDGSDKDILLRAALLPADRMVVTLLDVSQHRRALAAVRHSEERFRQIAETIDQVFWVVQTRPERIQYVSPAFETIWGRTAAELYETPRLWLEAIHPEDRAAVVQAYDPCLTGEAPGFLQLYRVVRPDGEIRWIEDAGYGLLDEDGSTYRLVGTAKDVTDGVMASRALRESDERFRQLADTLPSGLVVHCHGRIVYANRAAARAAGALHPRELVGQGIFDFVHPDSMAATEERIAAVYAKSSDPGWVESIFLRRDGASFPVEVASARIDWKGDPAGLVVFNDITGRRQAEERRRRLEQRIEEAQRTESLAVLAGGVAHDFNNLLVGILGNADLALMELQGDSTARERIKGVELAARRAADLARQMLAYSGKGHFVVDELDLQALLRESSHLLDASISKRVAIRYRLCDRAITVRGDATQIRQVLMNLITNAAEAMGESGGDITISSELRDYDAAALALLQAAPEAKPGTYAVVAIHDTGVGMDEATLRRIFDPFFTTKFTGRGLGLAAVQGIVRGHEGTIQVESQPGEGSTFRLLLPAHTESARRQSEAPERPAPPREGPAGTVLIVDDEETVLVVGSTMLEHAGFEVLTAPGGRAAVDLLRRDPHAIDCVLLDLSMPLMDGRECFQLLREIRPDIRVVLSSGYNEQEAVDRFEHEGLAGFIQKPYRATDLSAIIRQACDEEGIWE